MAVGVDYSAWLVQDGEIKRRFVYQESKTKQYVAAIYLDCKVEKGVTDTHTFLSFMFTPFRVVDGLDLGLSLALLDGGRPAPVGVNVTSVDNGQGALMSPREFPSAAAPIWTRICSISALTWSRSSMVRPKITIWGYKNET
jgi:hypothetical protein